MAELTEVIGRFLDGSDRSAKHVGEIEGVVIGCCQDEEWFDEVSESLALFVPGGGGYYLDELELAAVLRPLFDLLAGMRDAE